LNKFLPIYNEAKSKIDEIIDFDVLSDNLDFDNVTINIKQVILAATNLKFILDTINDELPKPKDKELRKIRKDFLDVLTACVSNGAMWLEYSRAPGSKIQRQKIVYFWSMAKGINKHLSDRITRITSR
jgi:hypothetical protein